MSEREDEEQPECSESRLGERCSSLSHRSVEDDSGNDNEKLSQQIPTENCYDQLIGQVAVRNQERDAEKYRERKYDRREQNGRERLQESAEPCDDGPVAILERIYGDHPCDGPYRHDAEKRYPPPGQATECDEQFHLALKDEQLHAAGYERHHDQEWRRTEDTHCPPERRQDVTAGEPLLFGLRLGSVLGPPSLGFSSLPRRI
ncbi:hypothetical protein HTIA_2287 [Halorhabdus tiamatea SARL4B]|uniref:Uncharacterized protein n=1 Tax=Halorhabdus tiamatea SARL4B TaxID=1033806 RepID=S6D910_9EURY|nr:hypothetical protein HTIA_2287 [Halorhabdus tiamatea SARL4B]